MFLNLPKDVRIVEVGPRDGLQNEKKVLETTDKVEFIKLLFEAGLKDIEVTSFVRPDRMAQMKDSKLLYENLKKQNLGGICLVPNLKGLETAIECGVDEIAIFTSTSNSFNKKNINVSIDESMARILPVMDEAQKNNMKIRAYISTAFGCPYEGEVDNLVLMKLAEQLFSHGCYEISIGDTIGAATPVMVQKLIFLLKSSYDLKNISMHFHDTRGMALANILTSLELGITSFDTSAAGLGGCPYAGTATGNIATEDVVYLMDCMGVRTGVEMDKLLKASSFIIEKLKNETIQSKYLKYLLGTCGK